MINELTGTIYELTEAMRQVLVAENDEEFERLLNERNKIMERVDALKAVEPGFQYSPEAKQHLEKTLQLDHEIAGLIMDNTAKTRNQLNQIRINRQVSTKYRPYYKQTNGAFIDSKN